MTYRYNKSAVKFKTDSQMTRTPAFGFLESVTNDFNAVYYANHAVTRDAVKQKIRLEQRKAYDYLPEGQKVGFLEFHRRDFDKFNQLGLMQKFGPEGQKYLKTPQQQHDAYINFVRGRISPEQAQELSQYALVRQQTIDDYERKRDYYGYRSQYTGSVGGFIGSMAGNLITDPFAMATIPLSVATGGSLPLARLALYEMVLAAPASSLNQLYQHNAARELGREGIGFGEGIKNVAIETVSAGLFEAGLGGLGKAFKSGKGAVKNYIQHLPDEQVKAMVAGLTPVFKKYRPKFVKKAHDALMQDEYVQAMRQANQNIANKTAPYIAMTRDNDMPYHYSHSLNPDVITFDANRFQFKQDGDAQGVTDTLKGVKTWDSESGGDVMVWQRQDGQQFIADGHQRLGLAQRLKARNKQDIQLKGYVYKEADGWQPADLRQRAALVNIRKNTGTVIDWAKILRESPHLTRNTLERLGVNVASHNGQLRYAQGLAHLSDDAFAMVINKQVDERYASLVGRLAMEATPDKDIHIPLLQYLKEHTPDNLHQAEYMIQGLLNEPVIKQTQRGLFGDITTTKIDYKTRAKILDGTRKKVLNEKRLFSSLIDDKDVIESVGANKLDSLVNARIKAENETIFSYVEAQANKKEEIGDALEKAVRAKAEHNMPLSKAIHAFMEDVRGIVKSGVVKNEKPAERAVKPHKIGDNGVGDEVASESVVDTIKKDLVDIDKAGDEIAELKHHMQENNMDDFFVFEDGLDEKKAVYNVVEDLEKDVLDMSQMQKCFGDVFKG